MSLQTYLVIFKSVKIMIQILSSTNMSLVSKMSRIHFVRTSRVEFYRVIFILHLIQISTESKTECWRDLPQPQERHLSPWTHTLDCLAAQEHQVQTGYMRILSLPAARSYAILLPSSGCLLTCEMGM